MLKPRLPNVKRLFKPDPGYVLCDVDLEQADAQVVAWTSGAPDLKAIFLDPSLNLHDENTKTIFGHYPVDSNDPNRKKAKAGVHATNYGATPYTLARVLGCTVKEAEQFQSKWFGAHPQILQWQQRVRHNCMTTRMVYNQFGFRRYFLGRVDERTVNEALAWEPQSTVGILINKVWQRVINEQTIPIEVKLQVHDSLVFQFKEKDLGKALPFIRECFRIPIPFDDPLIIGTGKPEVSRVSWGDCKAVAWETKLLAA